MCAIVKEGFYKFTGMTKFDQPVTTGATRGEYFTDWIEKITNIQSEYSPLKGITFSTWYKKDIYSERGNFKQTEMLSEIKPK